jgi:hypothetical protein
MTEVIEQRQSRDAKLADAYTDLEAPIRDLERCAIIADRFITDPSEEDEELFHFAVQQFHKMASDLVRLWDEKFDAAR